MLANYLHDYIRIHQLHRRRHRRSAYLQEFPASGIHNPLGILVLNCHHRLGVCRLIRHNLGHHRLIRPDVEVGWD